MDDTLIMFASKKTLRTLMLNLQNTIIVHGYKNCNKTRIYYSRVTFPLCTGKETRFRFQVSWPHLFQFSLLSSFAFLTFLQSFLLTVGFRHFHLILLFSGQSITEPCLKPRKIWSCPFQTFILLPWGYQIGGSLKQTDSSTSPSGWHVSTTRLWLLYHPPFFFSLSNLFFFFCTSYFVQNAAVIASKQKDASLQCVCFAFTTYGFKHCMHAMSQ